MASPPDPSSSRPLSSSRSLHGSQSIFPGTSNSRPFLHMLNPMGRTYQGYVPANQSVLEEGEEDNADGDHDLEAGHATRSTMSRSTKAKSNGKRRVAWGGDKSEMNALRPNVRQADPKQDEDSRQPLYSNSRRHVPPALPTTTSNGIPVSIPPRPSELDVDDTPPSEPLYEQPQKMRGLDAHERALWNWVNVYNLDAFLQEAYYYYEGKGIYSIALSRGLNLLTAGFVIGFSTFLLGCVDYSRIRPDKVTRLGNVIVDRCVSRFSGFTFLFFLLFTAFFAWQLVNYALGILRLVDMYRFYTYLLHIPDADIQTISWPEIVRRIGAIREDNPLTALSSTGAGQSVTAKLDAHDVANRIMRQENYLIALFNKELLDLRVPLPSLLERFVDSPEDGKGRVLTRALEWNLRFCLMEYLFDESGKVRKMFLKSKNRAVLIEGLRRRLIFMGILNAIFAPFIVLYLIMYSFFRYFEEYKNNPSNIGGRRYTPFAQWKFREFNELPHLFKRRLNESYPSATMYIGQFPNEKLTLIVRFVAFIAGSFAAVLLLASVIDPDLFLHFEITPHRTVLFYITIFGSILAVARGMIPEETRVFDPELLMTDVIQYTHYMPDEWKGQLHSKKVHEEFGELFAMKVMIFAQELLSVILTPFVLWYSLPPCAPAIVDFFREFTVHIDGLGYVCSFAVFDFQRHGNIKFGAPTQVQDERLMSKEGKMEKSFLNFKAAHPEWMPADPTGSLYLSRIADFSTAHPIGLGRRRLLRRPSDTGAPALGQLQESQGGLDATLQDPRQSVMARRRGGGSTLLQSTRGPGFGSLAVGGGAVTGASTIFQSAAGLDMAQTVALGDSQGSIMPLPPSARATQGTVKDTIPEEEFAEDGGVGSGLGESYVDTRRRTSSSQVREEEEEEDMADGGVLGLLAQIYGAGADVKGRGRGPPRAI
ncbi:autophagy protein Apg9-domain-containing protein [Fomitopsis serialis]|uniref:autophagy protein Apg9-domain-containing protein n=1 Tax=Fomitopsis serialis TaxID=139415 RepID=UPI0020085F87|nr:autophagy protein Apg9-domain-containing protein [Neoantrodia serialis]KAH9930780.1 autophagy protein Apg9-domain-containing protein [Neoantrodia serialis]